MQQNHFFVTSKIKCFFFSILLLQNYAEKYAEDPAAFFKDYAEAHAKLSNLGAKFDPPEVTSSYFVCYYLEPCT